MKHRKLILVLGDQLTLDRGALRDADPARDAVVMAEVVAEAQYVMHNRHKLVFIFSAMRHFRDTLLERGFSVSYFTYDMGIPTLYAAIEQALEPLEVDRIRCCEPGEHRLLDEMRQWEFGAPLELVEDDRFLATHATFSHWARNRKQLRMEYFYRELRQQYALLIDPTGKPQGGKWNYDAQNRAGWRAQETLPQRQPPAIDHITREVIQLVDAEFPDNPGDLRHFYLGVTSAAAQQQLQWFLDNGLRHFGTYQDGMAEESPWLFHSLISMYLNVGLLDPLSVCQQVEEAWRADHCELAAAEGFIRQVLGWREYVRGIYYLAGSEYAQGNALQATRPLPSWFWNGATDMRCLAAALKQSLDLGYAHHIQRLMIIGNFALLAGLHVSEVCDWYLGVYVDAFEWVELPNTLGMALFADGGLMASKPYAASGKYIQRQSNHCRHCRYDPKLMTGEQACPFNSLYWHFIERNLDILRKNPRMALTVRNWERKKPSEQTQIRDWAETALATHLTR